MDTHEAKRILKKNSLDSEQENALNSLVGKARAFDILNRKMLGKYVVVEVDNRYTIRSKHSRRKEITFDEYKDIQNARFFLSTGED